MKSYSAMCFCYSLDALLMISIYTILSFLQFEAALALTNIASGTSKNTNFVIAYGAVPIFVKLLAAPRDDIREQVTSQNLFIHLDIEALCICS